MGMNALKGGEFVYVDNIRSCDLLIKMLIRLFVQGLFFSIT